MTDRTHPDSGRATGAAHIIRYALELGLLWIDGDGRDKVREAHALELGLLWIDGDGRDKVREALDALDALEAQLEAVGAGGVSGQLMGRAPEGMVGGWIASQDQMPPPTTAAGSGKGE